MITSDERKLRRRSRISAVVTAVAAIMVLGALASSAVQIRRNKNLIKAQLDSIARNEATIRSLVPPALLSFGWRADSLGRAIAADPYLVKEALSANDELQSALRATPRPRITQVRYFARDTVRDVNQRMFIGSLTQLGFSVGVRRPLNPCPSNAFDFEQRVPIDEARLVAYAMIRAGMRIRYIGRITKPLDAPLLEIGVNWHARNAAPYTVAAIRTATEFPVTTSYAPLSSVELEEVERECGLPH